MLSRNYYAFDLCFADGDATTRLPLEHLKILNGLPLIHDHAGDLY